MRILLVSPYSWSVPGGVNSHVDGLAGALTRRGHRVRILAPADGRPPPSVISAGRSISVPFNGAVARLAFGPRVAARVRRTLQRERPDVVHVHEPFAPSVSVLALMFSRAPVVATFHADLPRSRLYRGAVPALRPLWRRLAGRIAVSEAAGATVERVFGVEPEIIPNGVATARYRGLPGPEAGAATVVFWGRLERRKGAHVLAAAVPHLRVRIPAARVIIAGDGPERRAVEAAVPPAHRHAVEMTGEVAPGALPGLVGRATVCCFPSLGGESFGVVLLEAMAAGRPVVASDIPGYRAVVDGGGMLVPPGDPVALAGALAGLLADPARARTLGERGRVAAGAYDWEVLAVRVEEAYRRAAGNR